jgi:hypothetical protein
MTVVARGRLGQFVALSIIFLIVLIGGTIGPAYVAAYEVRVAARTSCNQYMREVVYPASTTKGEGERLFLQGARRAGVKLDSDQYVMRQLPDDGSNAFLCQVEAAWRSQNSIFLLSTVLPDLPTIPITHRMKLNQAVMKSF